MSLGRLETEADLERWLEQHTNGGGSAAPPGLTLPDGSVNLGKLVSGTPRDTVVLDASGVPQYRSQFVYNVRDFGALGDDATDDRTAMQAALTACASTGGVVVLPYGTYLVSDYLLVSSHTVIAGAGIGATIVKVKAGSTLTGGLFQASNTAGVQISDMEIDLNKANTSNPASDAAGMAVYFSATNATGTTKAAVRRVWVHDGERLGLRSTATTPITNPNQVVFENCYVTDCNRQGILIENSAEVYVRRCYLYANNSLATGGGQIQASGSAGSSDVVIDGCTVIAGGSGILCHGIALAFIDAARVVNNACAGNGVSGGDGSGIAISEDCTNFIVAGNRCNENGAMGITVDVATAASAAIKDSRGVVANNVCSGSETTHGIYIQYCRDVSVTGNLCFDNPESGIMLVAAIECLVEGNICFDNDYGIRTEDDSVLSTDGGPDRIIGNYLHDNAVADIADNATNPSTGTDLWTAWVPSWTNLTVGNGTVSAKYMLIGKLVVYKISVLFGSSTSIGGTVSFSLPPPPTVALPGTGNPGIGQARFVDTGTTSFEGIVRQTNTTTANLRVLTTAGTYLDSGAALSSTVPHTWANTDELHITGYYETP